MSSREAKPISAPVPTTIPPGLARCAQFFAATVLWFCLFHLSGQLPPNSSCDASWELVMERAASEGWQFGRQIVFPFGPLGFLYGDHGSGRLFAARYAFAAVFSGLVVAASWCAARQMPYWAANFFLMWLGLYSRLEEQVLVLLACTAWMAMSTRGRMCRWDAVLCASGALLGCVKVNFLMMALVTSCACSLVCAMRGERARAWMHPLGLGICVLLVWLVCGQSVPNLFRFLWYNLDLTSGYSHAMSLPLRVDQLRVAVLSLVAFGALLGARFWQHRGNAERCVFLVLLAGLTFTTWKHAVVRGGSHFLFIHNWLPMATCLLLMHAWDVGASSRRKIFQGVLLLAAFIFGFDGVRHVVVLGYDRLPALGKRWTGTMRHLCLALPGCDRSRPADTDEVEPRYLGRLPGMSARIGREPVDIFHFQQGLAELNGLNPRFRPLLQSYTSYTPGLMELDWRFYQGEMAPRYLIFNLESIDVQYPTAAPSRLLPAWLGNFDLAIEEGGYLLFERSARPRRVVFEPLRSLELSFGEEVVLSEAEGGPVWCEIETELTRWGKARAFAFKGVPPILQVWLPFNEIKLHGIPLEFARSGFLLSPYLETSSDVGFLASGRGGRPVLRFRIFIPGETRGLYKSSLIVRLSRVRWLDSN